MDIHSCKALHIGIVSSGTPMIFVVVSHSLVFTCFFLHFFTTQWLSYFQEHLSSGCISFHLQFLNFLTTQRVAYFQEHLPSGCISFHLNFLHFLTTQRVAYFQEHLSSGRDILAILTVDHCWWIEMFIWAQYHFQFCCSL